MLYSRVLVDYFTYSIVYPEGGHGNSLHNSCLENPMDRGARWAIVCGVTKELDTT